MRLQTGIRLGRYEIVAFLGGLRDKRGALAGIGEVTTADLGG